MKPQIVLVAAVARNGIIGSDGDMPWKLSTDLKRFKALTMGKPMIMGRKTFQAIGGALPGRTSIVVTRDPSFSAEGAETAGSVDAALKMAADIAARTGAGEICVIGGGEIYRQTIDHADRLEITQVMAEPSGDTTFPAIDPDRWRVASQEDVPAGEKDSYPTRFIVYERASAPGGAR